MAGIGLAAWLGWVEITVAGSTASLVGTVALLAVLVLAFEALPEEVIMRGYVYRNLAAAMPPWAAVAVQAVLFALFGSLIWTINSGWEAAVDQAGVFLGMGVVLGCIRVMTRNVWACVGYHLDFQVVAQLLLGDRHPIVNVDRPESLMLVSFAAAFAVGPTIAALLSPAEVSWSRLEPDRPQADPATTLR